MMWLTARTRPDIAACLGILASLMVRRPVEVKAHLVCFWRYLWTTMDHAMCTLPSPKAAQIIQKEEQPTVNSSRAQEGPQPWQSSLKTQTYCDASFAAGLVSLYCWWMRIPTVRHSCCGKSRRQTLTALSAPEAEVVAPPPQKKKSCTLENCQVSFFIVF